MIRALQRHAANHALQYAIALCLALSASLQAFYDNFGELQQDAMSQLGWWQVLSLIAKCLSPGITAIVGYLMRSPLKVKNQIP